MDHYFESIFFVFSYVIFFGMLLVGKAKKSNRLVGDYQMAKDYNFLLKMHITGVVLFGIMPFIYTDKHLLPSKELSIFEGYITAVIVLIVVIFSLYVSGKDFLQKEKYLTKKIPANRSLLKYFFLRGLFICAYEMWFRGFLLSKLIGIYGMGIAIFLSVFFYALQHSVNGKREVISCIPFGILLCLVSVITNSIIPAIIIHLFLTLTYELNFLRLVKRKTFFSYANIRNRGYGIPGQQVGPHFS